MSEHLPKIDSGRYEIVSELAKGGMGVVYRAVDKHLGRPVALKIIKAGFLADEAQTKMFRREIEALAAVQNPNIITVHDVGEFQGQPFYTMDLIEGCTLEELLNRSGTERKKGESSSLKDAIAQVAQTRTSNAGNPPAASSPPPPVLVGKFRALPVNQALHIMVKILGALDYIHNRGIIHRDIKPSNIMLTRDGEPLLMDFGLAKSLDTKAGMTVTQTGQIMGTPAYMSPEQAEGLREGVNEKSDLYSMGAVFYELLTGRPPFIPSGHALADVNAVIFKTPHKVRRLNVQVPGDLETICHKALEKEPERRYRTARAFADDLERYAKGEPVLARPPSVFYRMRKKIVKHKVLFSVAALLAVLASAFLLFGLRSARTLREKDLALQEEKQKSEGRWRLVYENNFDGGNFDSLNWFLYYPHLNDMTAGVEGKTLVLRKTGKLFSKINAPGNVKLEFDAALEGDGEISGYFNCGDSLVSDDAFYHFCWNHNGVKIQKGRSGRVVDPRFFAERDFMDLRRLQRRFFHFQVMNENGRCRLWVDGELAVESRDIFYMDKINNGAWGFRSFGGKTSFDNLRVYHQLPPEYAGIEQIAGVHIAEGQYGKAASLLTKIILNYENPRLLGEAVSLFSAIEEKSPGDSVLKRTVANRAVVDRIIGRAGMASARFFLETAAARMPSGIRMPDFLHAVERFSELLPPPKRFELFVFWGLTFRYWKMDSIAGQFFDKARGINPDPAIEKYRDGIRRLSPGPVKGSQRLVEGGLLALSPDSVVSVGPFYIDTVEVTQPMFERHLGRDYLYFNSRNLPKIYSRADDGKMPADHVTWYEAVLFCNALSLSEGFKPCYRITRERDTLFVNPTPHSFAGERYRARIFDAAWDSSADGYRLPTPEEFEYAVTDEVPRPYFDGYLEPRMDDWTWNLKNSGDRSHPVARKKPNLRGLYDLAGNVWEWCWADSSLNKGKPGLPSANPEQPLLGGGRDELLESLGNFHLYSPPWSRNFDHGFRCVRTVFPGREVQ